MFAVVRLGNVFMFVKQARMSIHHLGQVPWYTHCTPATCNRSFHYIGRNGTKIVVVRKGLSVENPGCPSPEVPAWPPIYPVGTY